MSRRALIPAVALAVAVTGCSRTIDSDKAEKTIARLVAAKIGAPVRSVDCPSDKTATKGRTFTCHVTGKDGSAAGVVVSETDDKGSVRVAARLLPTGEIERSLAAKLTTQRHRPVGVDCQDIIIARKDVSFDCTTSAGKTKGRLRARQTDDHGRVRYRLVKDR